MTTGLCVGLSRMQSARTLSMVRVCVRLRAYNQKLVVASAKVVEPNGKEHSYYGELLVTPGITDGAGIVATSSPQIRITAKVPVDRVGFVPYTVFAIQHDPSSLSAVPFRVF